MTAFRTWTPWGVALVAAVALPFGLTGCGPDGPDGPGAQAAAFDDDTKGVVLTPGDPVVVTATEFEFTPSELVVDPGEYTGEFVNDGVVAHNITFASGESFDALPGESVEISFVVPEGGIDFVCSVAGHEEAGMSGELHTRTSADDDESD